MYELDRDEMGAQSDAIARLHHQADVLQLAARLLQFASEELRTELNAMQKTLNGAGDALRPGFQRDGRKISP